MELCKELAGNCDRLRPNLSRLATETDDKEESLGFYIFFAAGVFIDLIAIIDFILVDIIRTSDELGQVLERYEAVAKNIRPSNFSTSVRQPTLDLLDLGPSVQSQPYQPSSFSLDEQLLSLG